MSNLGPYAWLEREDGPRILKEALRHFGVVEVSGDGDNPTILGWARELGLTGYKHDETAWCGLFLALCAQRAGYPPPPTPLWALSWKNWGTPVDEPMLSDVLVFRRKVINPSTHKPELRGHTGLYVGEDARAFHVYGGNQNNRVSIARIARTRLVAGRRCVWRVGQPANVRRVWLSGKGDLSRGEG
ncbi:MAG TPA: TIGR02594 family protein [Gemmatimonadaceae bacterium]|nr:MAG: TIGR02594 family protein [Acidobacteriota bacterium]HTD83795.1 TIGR02594 family protein [Gemmatimonadaceae bacterium]